MNALHFKIGLKFSFKKNQNRFLSFISFASIAGIAIGVMALITVLSIMNGFQDELRNRILDMVSDIEIHSENNLIDNWQKVKNDVLTHPEVVSVSGILESQNMLISPIHKTNSPSIIQGILPKEETELDKKILVGKIDDLKQGEYKIILGNSLARKLNIFNIGEKVQVLTTSSTASPMGFTPRSRYFTVAGFFEFGMDDFDSNFAFIHLSDSQKLYKTEDRVSQLKVKLKDLFYAQKVSSELQKNQLKNLNLVAYDWSRKFSNFFEALKIEKRMMFIVLSLIIAVAAFNTISSMIMSVNDRLKNIAILRTIGMSKMDILSIFAIQGMLIGIIGLILGNLFGILIATNLDTIIPFIEQTFDIQFFPANIYYISKIPSNLKLNDLIFVNLVSFSLSFLATLYPCYFASRINPTDHLKYE